MLWKCDICTKVIDLQTAKQLTNAQVLSNYGFWKWVYNNTAVTEDSLGVYIQQLWDSPGGYKICDNCNSMLRNNESDLIHSQKLDVNLIAVVAGSIWKNKYGTWPKSIKLAQPPTHEGVSNSGSSTKKWWQFWK